MKVKNMVKELIAGEERAFDSGHASTLVQAADGTVIAAWFGGSWEGWPHGTLSFSGKKTGLLCCSIK